MDRVTMRHEREIIPSSRGSHATADRRRVERLPGSFLMEIAGRVEWQRDDRPTASRRELRFAPFLARSAFWDPELCL